MTVARMIAPQHPTEAAPVLRLEFALDDGHGPVVRATLRTSALGVVEAWVNGIPSSDELLVPGWTSYEWRVRRVEHDVTDAVATHTVIALRLGNGWWRATSASPARVPSTAMSGPATPSSRSPSPTVTSRRSSPTSRGARSTGEVLADDLYNGETIDARLRDTAWQLPGFDDSSWDAVKAVDFDSATLVAEASPPVRRLGEFAVRSTGPRRRARRSSISGRTSSASSACRSRARRNRGRAPPRRSARARRARHPPAAPRRGHRPLHPQRGTTTCSSPH